MGSHDIRDQFSQLQLEALQSRIEVASKGTIRQDEKFVSDLLQVIKQSNPRFLVEVAFPVLNRILESGKVSPILRAQIRSELQRQKGKVQQALSNGVEGLLMSNQQYLDTIEKLIASIESSSSTHRRGEERYRKHSVPEIRMTKKRFDEQLRLMSDEFSRLEARIQDYLRISQANLRTTQEHEKTVQDISEWIEAKRLVIERYKANGVSHDKALGRLVAETLAQFDFEKFGGEATRENALVIIKTLQ